MKITTIKQVEKIADQYTFIQTILVSNEKRIVALHNWNTGVERLITLGQVSQRQVSTLCTEIA
jgi:hypothetical protein